MKEQSTPMDIAVIGAGLAGASCAASLLGAGFRVTLFDKSHGVGGRMASRRVEWIGGDGGTQTATLDHGAQLFTARQPRFRAMLERARAAGAVAPWRPRVHAAWPTAPDRSGFVATPGMPALARHLAGDIPLRAGQAVQRLQRLDTGWQVILADGSSVGPFGHVMLALPPMQAAVLLAGHHDRWADALSAAPMLPCWTLLAVTDEVAWPWDAAEPDRGPLAWVARNDRKPGRETPAGIATWTAHAGTEWSVARLEADPQQVAAELGAALVALLPGGAEPRWHHCSAHRWRYAVPALAAPDQRGCWWDLRRGLGVCGDFLGGGTVEAAWRSGDELADTVIASLEEEGLALVPAA